MASSQHLPSGTLLMDGKYRVGHILGQGSFGITYMAVTKTVITGNLGTMEDEAKVAIKEFFLHDFNKREPSTPYVSGADNELFTEYRRKFRKEALHLTKLSHPGIIRVLDVFDENGTTYYAMEFVDGENLDDYISRKGSLTVEEAVEAMTEIGAALDYMHSKKMLHLDIKPRNIMRKSDGTFRIIDFGLSKSFDGSGFSESSSNIGLGTPGYASFEQAVGSKSDSLKVTMDVYSLGATLFKMLTGERPPLSSEIFNDGFPEETLKEKGIPTEIIEVVRKAMSPAISQRYQSVSDFVAALQQACYVCAETDGNEGEAVEKDVVGRPLPVAGDYTDLDQTIQPPPIRKAEQAQTEAEPPKTAKKRKGLITLIIVLLIAGILAAILFFAIKQTSAKNDVDPETGISSNTENLSDSQTDPVNQIDGEDPEELMDPEELIDPASETDQTDATDTTESEKVESEKNADQSSNKTETKVTGPAQITQNGITYTLNWSNKTATVKEASKDITTANIPAEINCNGVNFKVTKIGHDAFTFCSNLTSVTIPNGVTEIGYDAFSYCSNLTSVKIPESVTKIGYNALMSCENLTSITIPSSVTEIESHAFEHCKNLTHINVDSRNRFFSSIDGVIYSKDKTKIITYPPGKKGAFIIPENVKEIGEDAFRVCYDLTSVTIPLGVKKIESGAFNGCSNLTSVKIPSSVTEIGDWAFNGCKNLTSVDISNGVKVIGNSAFADCENLTSVTIPDSVTEIGDSAFSDCKNLTSITIPNSVTEIGYGAFYWCSNLTSITIPNSVKKIGRNAFNMCNKLTEINVNSRNQYFCSIDGVLYSKDKTKIIRYPGGKNGAFIIPASVKEIEKNAFSSCSNLTSVTIQNGVKKIGEDAFQYCSNLTSVDIPSSVTEIELAAFWGCSKLTSVTIQNGVKKIGRMVFYQCKNLTSVDIPNSVTEIGDEAFMDCPKLDVTYPTRAKIGYNAFYGCLSATPRD